MYAKMGIAWASSLLGFASLIMAVIPFAFLRYGEGIRARSVFCQELKRRKGLEGDDDGAMQEREQGFSSGEKISGGSEDV